MECVRTTICNIRQRSNTEVTFDDVLLKEEALMVWSPMPFWASKAPQVCIEVPHDNRRTQLLGFLYHLFQLS